MDETIAGARTLRRAHDAGSAKHRARRLQKGAGAMPAPETCAALGCPWSTRARFAPARRQAAYIFLAFFFAFFAIVSSCASDTSCETPTRKTKLGFMRAATGFCQNANHPKKLNVRSGEY
jgi:hypothetical protein